MRSRTLSIVFVALGLALAGACKDKPAAPAAKAAAEPPVRRGDSTIRAGEVPVPRRVPITVTRVGYEPNRIDAKGREVITLVFTRTEDGGCGEVVRVKGTDLRADLPLNKPVELTVTLPPSGELVFACGMDMMHGIVSITPAS
jgi:plastocyanin domain-containing protein